MNRRTEYILALIGAIVNTIVIGCVGMLVMIGFIASFFPEDFTAGDVLFGVIGLGIYFLFFLLLMGASVVLGFISANKLKYNAPEAKNWGVVLIVLGGMQIASIHGILYLISGIMTVVKRENSYN